METFQEASPINRAQLDDIGWRVRELLEFTTHRWLPVPHILEHMLPTLYGEDFAFRVGFFAEIGSNHGFADPDNLELVLREDVYEGLVDGCGRDRMTAIHETSHLILHQKTDCFGV